MSFAALAPAAMQGLAVTLGLAFATWIASVAKRDVSIVDSVWALLIVGAGFGYAAASPAVTERAVLALALATLWAARLSIYITWRNWGEGEDRRYQEIRARNQPGFTFKSLYLVFALQAVLAWIVSWSLLAAVASERPLGWLDALGAAAMLFGLGFEAIADAQLARFKADPAQHGKVLDRGLWRYTRHPNYFGECCVWWGAYVIALSAGGWWAIVSPLVMTVLLLKVSGVTLLEKDIGERRPAYRDYVERTNAFVPGPPRPRARTT